MSRVYLAVPYLEKDQAKKLGAKFDFKNKKWFVSDDTDLKPFDRWLVDNQTYQHSTNDSTSSPYLTTHYQNELVGSATSLFDSIAPSPITHQQDSQISPPIFSQVDSSPETAFSQTQPTIQAVSLKQLLQKIEQTIADQFDSGVWVYFEIAQIKSATNGHYYLDIIERDPETNQELAKARAMIWNYQSDIVSKFEQQTQQKLSVSHKILAKVLCQFHPRYSFSLQIIAIDARFTLGEMQKHLQRIRQAIQAQGIWLNNRNLKQPQQLYRLAIISPPKSAGLTDFNHYLTPLIKHNIFQCDYFYETFQGDKVAQGLSTLIKRVSSEHSDKSNYDVLIILRGGGAISDLQYLENQILIEAICNCPIPVWSGIGHQTDRLLIDEVANKCFPTPTAIARHLIAQIQAPLLEARKQWHSITNLAGLVVEKTRSRMSYHQLQLINNSHRIIPNQRLQLTQQYQQLTLLTQQLLQQRHQRLAQLKQLMSQQLKQTQQQQQQTLAQLNQQLDTHSKQQLNQIKQQLHWLDLILQAADPQRILQRGFAIVRTPQQQALTSKQQLLQHDKLLLQMHDGEVTVKNISD